MAGLSHAEVDEILALLFRLNEQGVTMIMIEHIMRAVMRFSERLVVLVAGQQDRRRAAGGRRARSRGREGLPWRVASPSPASTPATARCACCTTCRSTVGAGETVVLLGTNGNGKSTLMKCIMGMVRPAAGSIIAEIDGTEHDLVGRATEEIVDLGIGWCPRAGGCSRKLTVEENLLLGAFRPTARAQIARNLDFCFETFPRAEGAPRASSPAA